MSGVAGLQCRDHGIRRFVTATDSVAAPRSKVEPEMLRASTRTVSPDQGRRTVGSVTAPSP